MSRITKQFKSVTSIKILPLFLLSGVSMNLAASENAAPLSGLLTPLKIEKNESHIFSYGFEELDENSDTQQICEYISVFSKQSGICEFNTEVKVVRDEYRGNVLRIPQAPRKEGSRFLFRLRTPILEGEDELYISYWIRFSDDFDLGKGGKLPGGLYGVVRDKPYPSAGNKIEGDSGFSVRSMFYTRGYDGEEQEIANFPHLYTYVYHQDMKTKFGDRESYTWRNKPVDFIRKTEDSAVAKLSSSKTEFYKPGYLFVMRVKLNTPNVNDGLVQIFLNGVKVLENSEYMFSKSGENKINRAEFSFFYGGNDSWQPINEEEQKSYLEIDDITISKNKINIK